VSSAWGELQVWNRDQEGAVTVITRPVDEDD
jgi:hypothetical protein